MVAGIFYILAAMVVVAHASPHTDHANGFVLNMQFSTNSGKVNSWISEVHLLKVQLLVNTKFFLSEISWLSIKHLHLIGTDWAHNILA